MGAWGTAFWQNDTALDVREDFKEYFKYGLTDEEGIQTVLKYSRDIDDPDDGPVVTMVIAYELWKIGRLTDEWKEKAGAAGVQDVEKWRNETDEKTCRQREKVINNFLSKLDLPQPEPKKIKRIELFVNKWVPGDVIAIKNTTNIAVCRHKGEKDEYHDKGEYIIYIIEDYYSKKNFFRGYVKYSPGYRSVKNISDMDNMALLPKKYGLEIMGADEAKKCVYLGNVKDSLNSFPHLPPLYVTKTIYSFKLLPFYAITHYYEEIEGCYDAGENFRKR